MKIFVLIFLMSAIHVGKVNGQVRINLDNHRHIVIKVNNTHTNIEGYEGEEILVLNNQTKISQVDLQSQLIKTADKDTLLSKGISYHTTSNDSLFEIRIADKSEDLQIKIPLTSSFLSIDVVAPSPNSSLSVNNFFSPIEINGYVNNLTIKKVSGPFYINTYFSKVTLTDIIWKQKSAWSLHSAPYNIHTIGADIKVSMPADLKAQLNITNENGETFSDLNLKPGILLNGGGVEITISNKNGNIYLKKEKK